MSQALSLASPRFPSPADDPGRVWGEIKGALRFKSTYKPRPIRGKGGDKEDGSSLAEKSKVPPPSENAEGGNAPCEPSVIKEPLPVDEPLVDEPLVDEPNKTVPRDDGSVGLLASLEFWADKSAEDSPTFMAVCRSSYGLNVYRVDLEYEPPPGRSPAAIAEEREYFDACLSWEQTSFCGQSFWGQEYTPRTQTHSSDDDSHSIISAATKSTDTTCHTESSGGEGK